MILETRDFTQKTAGEHKSTVVEFDSQAQALIRMTGLLISICVV